MSDRSDSPPLRVAIVGGGVTGLAAASALVRQAGAEGGQPVEVTLLESGYRLGGKVQTDHVGSLVIEHGPDALFVRDGFAEGLLREVGLGDQVVRANPAHRQSFIVRGGSLHRIPDGMESGVPRSIWPMARSELLTPVGKLRAALEVAVPRGRPAEDESADAFVRRRFGPEVADRVAAPLLGGIYSADIRNLSLQATQPHLRAWERQHRSLLLASWTGRLPRPPKRGPASVSPFLTLRGGLEDLIGALVPKGPRLRVRLGSEVRRLQPTGIGGEGRFELTLAGAERVEADAVIVATPAFVAADLVAPLVPAAMRLADVRYASVAVIALAYPSAAAGMLPPGSGFLVDPEEPGLMAACSWSSRKWPHCAPDGEVLVRAHVHADRHPEALAGSDEALVETIRSELDYLVGLRGEPLLARVYRWPRSIPSYDVGHLQRLSEIETGLSEFPGLVLAGAGCRGVGLPECLRQGVRAAERVVAERTRGRKPGQVVAPSPL